MITRRFRTVIVFTLVALLPLIATAENYGSTPQLDIPNPGETGWGTKVQSSLKALSDFNANYANPDGTLKAGVSATQWAQGPTAYYISANSINIQGDQTALFEVGRKVWINQAVDVIGTVQSAAFGNGWTAVTLSPIVLYSDNSTASIVTNDITSISVGLNTPRSNPSAQVNIAEEIPGYIQLGKISYSTTSVITIDPSIVEANDGANSKILYWNSTLTFTFGPSGSNSSSSALGATGWQYIYVNAALSASNPVTASGLINLTSAPVYNAVKHGWYYSTNWRCIAAFRTNASSQLEKFLNEEDWFYWVEPYAEWWGANLFVNAGTSTTPVTVSPDVPVSTSLIQLHIYRDNMAAGSSQNLYLYIDGGTNNFIRIGHQFSPGGQVHRGNINMPLDANRQLQYKVSAGNVYLRTLAYKTNF